MKYLSFLIIVLTLACGTVARAQTPFTDPGQPVVFGAGYDVPSAALGDVRRVNIMLPPGYDDEDRKEARYPVLYLLDGGAGWQDFIHIAGMIYQGSLWGGGNQPMIVVGIESKDRRREFTTPSMDPKEQADFPTHGEADRMRTFLVSELRPLIDAAYRTDGVEGVMGESLAGYFVMDTALRHGDAFDRYIAISPSLWWNQQALTNQAADLLAAAPAGAPRVLWYTVGDEGGSMQSGLERISAALRERADPAIVWSYNPMLTESHATIYHPAATRAIRAVFPAKAP